MDKRTRDKSILVVSNFYPPNIVGGAEVIAYHQAQALSRFGHRVAVFAGEAHIPGNRYEMRRELHEGITVFRVHLAGEDYSIDRASFHHAEVTRRFSEVFQEIKPDVVHMHNLNGLSCGVVGVAARGGARTVLTLHDHWGFCLKNTLLKVGSEVCSDYSRCAECMPVISGGVNRNIPIRLRNDYLAFELARVDAFVSPSRYLADTYVRAGFPAKKMNVIWNGLDVRRFAAVQKSSRQGKVRFSFLGYFGEHKGIQTILDALPLLSGLEQIQLNLVGDGHLRPHLETIVASRGLGAFVRFWGKVNFQEIERVFAETDVQILSSVWPENQPVSITEAMASRTAVIASDLGGSSELVINGKTGYLYKANDPVDLARKMARLLESPDLIEEFGRQAYERIRENTLENQTRKLLDLYDSLQPALPERRPVVMLIGDRVNLRTSGAIERLSGASARHRLLLVMSEWLEEADLQQAAVAWVANEGSIPLVLPALRSGVPLLVPAENEELRRMVIDAECGLYQANAEEAAECITWLIEHNAVRRELGANGQRYANSRFPSDD